MCSLVIPGPLGKLHHRPHTQDPPGEPAHGINENNENKTLHSRHLKTAQLHSTLVGWDLQVTSQTASTVIRPGSSSQNLA